MLLNLKAFQMSDNKYPNTQTTLNKNGADDKSKIAPSAAKPVTQSGVKSTEAKPDYKS